MRSAHRCMLPREISELPDVLVDSDIVISSVPAQIVTKEMLMKLPKHALLVDLAAPPGGIDRQAAADLNLKFVWARGMGSRAPVTVGRSQWVGIRRRIETIMEARQ